MKCTKREWKNRRGSPALLWLCTTTGSSCGGSSQEASCKEWMLLFIQVIFLQFCLSVYNIAQELVEHDSFCWHFLGENKLEDLCCISVSLTSEGKKKSVFINLSVTYSRV